MLGATIAPAALRATKKSKQATTGTPNDPTLPAQGFERLMRALLGDRQSNAHICFGRLDRRDDER